MNPAGGSGRTRRTRADVPSRYIRSMIETRDQRRVRVGRWGVGSALMGLAGSVLWGCAAGGAAGRDGASGAPGADAGGPPAAASAGRFVGGAVAADHPLASEAGSRVLESGGNAVDAAVATSFALSVVRPHSCGIGGGGFMVIALPDDPRTRRVGDAVRVAVDYRERAPASVGPDYYEPLATGSSRWGGHAVAVPGTVAGLLLAHERFGVLERSEVLAPAIGLARVGYEVDADAARAGRELAAYLENRPGGRDGWTAGERWLWETFARPDRRRVGARIALPGQARVLERISELGPRGFYAGPVARATASAVREAGGSLTARDLRAADDAAGPRRAAQFVEPLRRERFGFDVLAMPLPSSGGVTTLQVLGLLESAERRGVIRLAGEPFGSPVRGHALVEAMKHAFADRARLLGDPEFVRVDVEGMLDAGALARRARTLAEPETRGPEGYGVASGGPGDAPPGDGGTSHLSVFDADGGAVACTETINLRFGSRVAVPEFGFVLNNQMDDFLTRRGEANAFGLVQAERNLPAPGKRPLSSMSPTVVLDREGRAVLAAGASGGPRIITSTLQVLLGVLVDGASVGESVSRPRLHHQWRPDAVRAEAGYDPDALDALRRRGHEVEVTADALGVVQAVGVRERGGGPAVEAASDGRKGGAPAGPRDR